MEKKRFLNKALLLLQLIVSLLLILGLKSWSDASQDLGMVMGNEFQQEVSDLESYVDPSAFKGSVVYQKNSPIVVEASALEEESPQERMRQQRIEVEKETERKVFTKIENDRLKEEAKRRKEIMRRLEDKMEAEKDEQQSATKQPVQPQPVASVNPIVITTAPSVDKEDKNSGVPLYIGAGAGMNMFPHVYNIKPGLAMSVALGALFRDVWLAEVTGTYSIFNISPGYYRTWYYGENQVQEFGVSLGVKRHLSKGTFRPLIGFSSAYRFRRHRDTYNIFSRFNEIKSHGIDMGVTAGVDFVLSDHLSIGTEIKYMMNLTNSLPMNAYHSEFYGYRLSDELKYFTFGINAKLLF